MVVVVRVTGLKAGVNDSVLRLASLFQVTGLKAGVNDSVILPIETSRLKGTFSLTPALRPVLQNLLTRSRFNGF